MEKQKQGFMKWIKEHKKELIIAGISVAVIIGMIIACKNNDSLNDLWNSLRKGLEKKAKNDVKEPIVLAEIIPMPIREETAPCVVNEHIRNLHTGWNPSKEKLLTAREHGYVLEAGQTWVEEYERGNKIA